MFTLFLTTLMTLAPAETIADETVVERVHQVTGLAPTLEAEQVWFPLTPITLGGWGAHAEVDGFEQDDDVYVSMIYELIGGEEFDYEDRALESLGEGRLLVRAPVAVHRRVDRLLSSLAAAFQRRAILVMEVYELSEAPAAGVDLDAWVADGRARPLRTFREEVHVGVTHAVRAERTHRIAMRAEAEIAQSSWLLGPELVSFTSGTFAVVRVEDVPGRDHQRLRFALRLSELTEVLERRFDYRGMFARESGIDLLPAGGSVRLPRVSVASSVGSRVVGVGEAVHVASYVETDVGLVPLLVRLAVEHVDPRPARFSLADGSGDDDLEIAVADVSGLVWGPVAVPRIGPSRLFVPENRGDEEAFGLPHAALPGEAFETDHAWTAIWEACGDVPSYRVGSFAVVGATGDALDRARDRLAERGAPAGGVVVEARLVEPARSRGREHVVAYARLPLEAGAAGLTVMGAVDFALDAHDVDVANGAAIASPSIAGFLDGVVLRAEAHRSGRTLVRVVGHRVVDRAEVDLGSSTLPPVDEIGFDVFDVERTLAADGATHTVSGLGGAFGEDTGLRLELAVRAE